MRVDHLRVAMAVPAQFLDRADALPALEQVGGE
jgi:glycine betaine/choline ABC-type transport system substrate-binding protein